MKSTEIILAFATLVAIASCTQSTTPTCIVEGNLTGLEGDGWVYMTDMWNDGEVIDSTEYHNGVFRFEVSAEEPTMVFLHADCFAHLHRFFNDPGIITLTGSAEDARKARVGGTPMNDYLLKMESKLNENLGEQSLLKRMEACTELYTSALEENAGNALSVRLIQQSTVGFHPSILLEYINQLEPYLKEKAFTKELNDELERLLLVSPAIEGCDVKPYYIDMEYPDVNGNMIKLSDVVNNPKNRYVYIDFWATWCGPCRMYMESLAKTYEKYKDNGFEVYTVSCDTNTEAWKKLVAEKDFGWIDVIGGMSMPEWKSYVVTSVPTSILIDCSTGLIIGRELYEDLLDDKLKELLGAEQLEVRF